MVNRFTLKVLLTAAALSLLAMMSAAPAQDFVKSPVGAKHVILIGYDGFGGNYVQWDQLPNLSRFRDRGAWTLKKRSVLPSGSALNWESILTGAGSELHGFRTAGSKAPDLPSAFLTENGRFPDIFYLTRQAYPASKLYACYSWDGIGYLFDK
ncbi:MAG: alkaline phosphatase family protein, partial [Thermoguttaceae bacterium]|nr:alkaline phosphatase family protein [Thermoguttaceae bacterium]